MKYENIKNLKIEYTVIEEVTYEDKGFFVCEDGFVHENLPEFCRVCFTSKPGEGSLIYSEVWLPKDWNGIFVGTGNGGMAGNVYTHALAEYVRGGYAAANTDMGTSRGRSSGIDNPDVWADFGRRSTHVMTVSAKEIIYAYYGKNPAYSYFVGSSTGGQQALTMAQFYPKDYDGIVAGVPANNRTMLHTYFLWNHVHLRPKNRGPLFGDEEIVSISKFAAEYFQSLGDGEAGDNFVTMPRGEDEAIEGFIGFLEGKNEFTAEQLRALECVYRGPVNPNTGERIYNGMPIGSEKYGCGIKDCQSEESPHFYPFIWTFGENYDGYSFDFDKDMEAVNEKLAGYLNSNSVELDEFFNKNGKLIMFSGSADPCVPFPDAMRYFERVMERYGGYESVADKFRYFLFPGKDHGDGGDGVSDIWATESGGSCLDALRAWKEEGVEPGYLVGVGYSDGDKKEVRFKRKIYPYGSGEAAVQLKGKCPPACSRGYLKIES